MRSNSRLRMPTLLQHLTLAQRFMLVSLVVIILGALGLGWWVGRQIRSGVVNRAGATTALYVDSFIAPRLQELAWNRELSAANVDTLNKLFDGTSLGRQIIAFKVWDLDGKVVFSSDPAILGDTFPMHEALIRASQGNVSARLDAADVENATQRAAFSELLEIYSPVRLAGTNQVIAVAEFYQTTEALRGEIGAAQRRSWLVVGIVMGLIYLALIGFVRRASDTIDGQQMALNRQIVQLRDLLEQNKTLSERVRRAAAGVSAGHEQLLRRVGADLHDGPAQDLGLALLQMDTVLNHIERTPGAEQQRAELVRLQTMLQGTLQEMRAIAAGFSLPQLADLNLEETFVRVVRAHERRTGATVALSLGEMPADAALVTKMTVYRVVQEALNNAHRHGGAGLTVHASAQSDRLMFEIHDEGAGFDPQALAGSSEHLGLSGMRERVESVGGQFQLESAPGSGTRILAELPLKAEGAKND